jgi:HK97 family phage major capsid protein
MTALELRQKSDELLTKADALSTKAEEENRDLTEDEQGEFDKMLAEVDKLQERAERLDEMEKRRATMDEPVGTPPPKNSPITSPNDTKRFGSLGEQILAVIQAQTPGSRSFDNRLIEHRATGLGESIPSEGGFLVQSDFSSELLNETYETALLPSSCRKVKISSPSNRVTINAIAESSRADGSRGGGVLGYWLSEAGTKTASKPEFRQIELVLKKLAGLCYLTDEMKQDVAAIDSIVRSSFADEFGFLLDDAIMNGTGAGMPQGILGSPALVTVAKGGGQAADTITSENIMDMYARMWPRSLGNAKWYISQNAWPQIFSLSLAVGDGGAPMFIPAGSISQKPYSTLMGQPIIPIEQCQKLGDKGDIYFADLSKYYLADKGGLESAESIHVRFVYDETTLRFVYRVDGQPAWVSAMTPYNGGDDLSPFVTLAERA